MHIVNRNNLKKILILIGSAIAILAITLSIYSQIANAQEPYSPSPDSFPAPKSLVEVKMTAIGVDPVKNELETRLEFELKGIIKKGQLTLLKIC